MAARAGRVGVGIIGAGMISDAYLENLTTFPDVEVVAIGDIALDRAKAQAEKWGVAGSGTAEDLLADDDIEIIVNLTIPAAHVPVSTSALRAGKHVWSEKPIGVDRETAKGLVELAASLDLKLGIAPDTVLGAGWQSAKRAIESGIIGTPVSAVTLFHWQGPDWIHPNPEFLFAHGGGPLFDFGPYYFTALVHLLGPIASVAATGTKLKEVREVRSGARAGETFPVEVPTHLSVLTSFEQGGSAQSLLSFDTPLVRMGLFEVHGTEGSIVLPDPNTFGGSELRVARPMDPIVFPFEQAFEVVPEEGELVGRGLGVLDMARAIRTGGVHIATGDVGYHVLDTMVSVLESVDRKAFVDVESTVGPVPSLPSGFDPRAATL